MVYVYRTYRVGSSFKKAPAMNQPISAVSTALWWIFKNGLEKVTVTHSESHVTCDERSKSAEDQRKAAISKQ